MPGSQDEHMHYTTSEWMQPPYSDFLAVVFADPTVKNFVDIGANVGGVIHVLNNLSYLDRLDKVVCFEPDIDNFNYMNTHFEHIRNTKPVNVVCHNIGIYYGQTEMGVCGAGDNNVGGYFLADEKITSTRPFAVLPYESKVFKLDEIEKYFVDESVDVVKIDIEGGELNILEHSVLLKNCKYMLLEWHFSCQEFDAFFDQHLAQYYNVLREDRVQNQYLLKHKHRE